MKARLSIKTLTASLLLAFATAFTLNACSSDDDKGGSSGGGSSKWCSATPNPDDGFVMCAEIGKPAVTQVEDIAKEGDTFTEEVCRNVDATISENKPNNCDGFVTYSGGSGEWCVVTPPDDNSFCAELGKKLTISSPDGFMTKGEVFTREKCNMMVSGGFATIKTKPESCVIFTE